MTWHQINTVIINEFRLILREKTFLLLLFVFLLMAFFSAYIGWSTNTIVFLVYQEAISILKQSGISHMPPNPFYLIPPLSIFKNMIIYNFLIGALLAIILGHRSFIRERKSGVVLLLFSKPISKSNYIAGKMLGILLSLVTVLGITWIISILSTLFIPHQLISLPEIEKFTLFYFISLVYLLIFSFIGFFFATILPDESLALFAPIILWVAVTFIFPELITGQNPVALLNPTNIIQTAPRETFFKIMQTFLSPLSIEQHYAGIAQALLETGQHVHKLSLLEALSANILAIFSLFFYLLATCIISVFALNAYSASKDKMYE